MSVENMKRAGYPVITRADAGDGYRYMKLEKAGWEDLVAGLQIREENVRRAQSKLDTYRGALRQLRPIMEGTNLTFTEAYPDCRTSERECH